MRNPDEIANIPIAIIGMACRLPGAENLDQFWKMLIEGRSAVAELPADRLDQELYYDPKVGVQGKTYSKLAAILSNREFNRQACPISDELADAADDAHLLMCEVAAEACRHAGLDPFQLKQKNTGVYIGHAQGSGLSGDLTYATYAAEAAEFLREVEGYQSLDPTTQNEVINALTAQIRQKGSHSKSEKMDLAANLVAGTISKAFGLTGPFLAINSACASSLHAILIGARALQLGRVEMAIVGGASDCKSDTLVLFSHAQAMSSTGTRPFAADADGLICSEGYAALVLKTLDQALADGDPIQAVVRGTGISSDGKGKSLWAPRKEGQTKAMQRAYRTGVSMADLQYIEAHSTATQLGDATELNTLSEVLADHIQPNKKIPIGSLKANIGHSLETAGVAGLIKTVLAMQHATIPPAINVDKLNPKIDWDQVPVYVPKSPEPWPQPAPGKSRCAGVNAFGIGGLNMHVVVEQFNAATSVPKPSQVKRSAADPDDEAVAIVGMGCVLPGALNIPAFWDLLVSGRDPKQGVPAGRWRTDLAYRPGSREAYQTYSQTGGFITDFEYDWRTHKVPPKQIAQADPLQFMLLDAADQAFTDAGYNTRPFDRTRVGVVVGTEFGGDFAFQLQMGLRLPEMRQTLSRLLAARNVSSDQISKIAADFSKTLLKHWPALVDETGSFSTSSLASRISKTWNLMGGAAAVDCGSASSISALSLCIDGLLAGDSDMMICAAGQRRLGLPTYESMSKAGSLAQDGTNRSPLDAHAEGHLPGEGVGVVLLKRLADARRDGDPIKGIIRGIGCGHSNDWGNSLQLAIERALSMASASAEDVELLETDTLDSAEDNQQQHRVIASALGQANRQRPLLVSSAIGQIGHTVGASGMVSLIKACLELKHGQIPSTFGTNVPTSALALNPKSLQVAIQSTPIDKSRNSASRLAAVNSSTRKLAFHVLLEDGEQVKASQSQKLPAVPIATETADWRIGRLGASSLDQLLGRLAEAQRNPAQLFAAAESTRFNSTDRFRLAIVAGSAEAMAAKINTAGKHLTQPAAREVLQQQGIFYHELSPQPPRIAFLLAGQGSQYAGMMQPLVDQVPAARVALAEADQVMQQQGFPTFAQMAWEESAQLGSDVWTIQASLLIANSIMLNTLADRGIQANLVAGQSYGEYAALLAAHAWNLADAVRVTRARCEGIEEVAAARGGMLATNAPPEVGQQLANRLAEPVFLATHNAPEQTVMGGSEAGLTQLASLLEQESYQARRLAVPCPFHTPLMKDAVGPLTAALAATRFQQPSIETWSVVTNRPVTGPDEIRRNLVAHMTTPVRYVDLIRSIAAQQETVFVEVGPQQALTRLHRQILDNTKVLAIASDNSKRPGEEQIYHVQAMLESTGAWQPETVNGVQSIVATAKPSPSPSQIFSFDATACRREKMRRAAASKSLPAAAVPVAAPTPPVPPVVPPVAQAPAPAAPVEKTPDTKTSDTSQLESFLINFVVDQTGYPPEVIELDADLEADLGIDSIKKAQLFGELQEYFDIEASEDLTLDDFPTLRHVLNFLAGAPAASQSIDVAPPQVEAAPIPAAPPQPAAPTAETDTTQLESFLINFVVEQTGYPPEVIELDADLEADLGIDSIKKAQLFGELQEYFDIEASEDLTLDDFPTLRHVLNFLAGAPAVGDAISPTQAATEAALPQPAAPTAETDTTQLESFLINFVVEQTGYPPEVIELDADLEADLGIDSIKKAQLFGELQEYFDIEASEELTLDDFPTLRHVLNFLAAATTTAVEEPQHETTVSPEKFAPAATIEANGHHDLAYQRGHKHGLANRMEIQQTLRNYTDMLEPPLAKLGFSSEQLRNPSQLIDQQELQQLQGIAAAVEVPLGSVVVHRLRSGPLLPENTPAASTVDNRFDEIPIEDSSTHRYVMRMIDSPLPANPSKPRPWNGPALVVGQNPTARALCQQLASEGVSVESLPVSDDIDETLATFEKIWRERPTPHLFLTTARDLQPISPHDTHGWQQRQNQGAMLPYLLCQRWIQLAAEAGMLKQCTLTGLTALGGDFGFSGNVSSVESGAITGLLKAICIEFQIMQSLDGMRVVAIDAPDDESPELLAENVCRELASDSTDYEVAYVAGKRGLQNAVACPVESKPAVDIHRGENWVVTGGARGITASCALELARKFGIRLHLIGKSPRPQIDPSWRGLDEEGLKQLKATIMIAARDSGRSIHSEWERVEKDIEIDRCLQTFAESGVEAHYHSCDVSDSAALATVLDTIRQTSGPIEGILHGAGIDKSCRFEKKDYHLVRSTLGAKVDGARHLMALTRNDPVRRFIAFGSVSGRLGSNGQTDYCLASDQLAKLIGWYQAERPSCRAVCFHWHPWDEVGMAARPESRAMFEMSDALELMPKREGLQHFLSELHAANPNHEVLVTTQDYHQRYYGRRNEATSTDLLPGDTKWDQPLPADQRIAHREALVCTPAPLPPATPNTSWLEQPVWILGNNPSALAMQQRLTAQGVAVHRFDPQEDADLVLSAMEKQWAFESAPTLLLMTARDPEANNLHSQTTWQHRKAVGVLLPYLVTQLWVQLLAKHPGRPTGTLVAATALGGDFGCSGNINAPEGGALAGMVKSLAIEASRNGPNKLRAKVIDAPANESPEQLAEAICSELAANQPEVEIGWSRGMRSIVKSVPQSIEYFERTDLPQGGTWVVTGGARGITAATAYVLGRRYRAKLHLLGHSPAPQPDSPWRGANEEQLKTIKAQIVREAIAAGVSPEENWLRVKKDIEIQENLDRLTTAGVQATYHQCDLSDWDALARVLEQVRNADGPIEAVIHGAGYSRPSRLQEKTRKHLHQAIASKCDGTVALMALTRQDPIRWFVGFGSISGRFGGNGLSDYAAANDMLAKLIGWYRQQRPECQAACFHWQSWDEVGMAMNPDSALGAKGVLKMDFISPREGIDHLHQELRAELPASEVLIDDGHFFKTIHSRSLEEARLTDEAPVLNNSTPAPLIDSIDHDDQTGQMTAHLRLNPTVDPFLVHHLLGGKRYLPGVIGIEAIAEAASQQRNSGQVIQVRDIQIVNGLPFHSDNPVQTKVSVTPVDNALKCVFSTEHRDRKGRLIEAQRPLVTAVVPINPSDSNANPSPPGEPPLGWHEYQYPDTGMMLHGPPLQTLKACAFHHSGGWGKLLAPSTAELAGPRSSDGWVLPPALLDGCVVACGSFVYLQFQGALEVPNGMDSLRLHRPARSGETCLLKFTFLGREGHHSRFDFHLFGEDDQLILEVEGYRTIRVTKGGAP